MYLTQRRGALRALSGFAFGCCTDCWNGTRWFGCLRPLTPPPLFDGKWGGPCQFSCLLARFPVAREVDGFGAGGAFFISWLCVEMALEAYILSDNLLPNKVSSLSEICTSCKKDLSRPGVINFIRASVFWKRRSDNMRQPSLINLMAFCLEICQL